MDEVPQVLYLAVYSILEVFVEKPASAKPRRQMLS